jgi:hypothetical protein
MFGSWGSSTESGYVHWLGVGSESEIKVLQARFFGAEGAIAIEQAMPSGVEIDRYRNSDFLHLRPYCGKQ